MGARDNDRGQGRGSRSNEIPCTWQLGHLKVRAGILVSRSLILPLPLHPKREALFDDFSRAPQIKIGIMIEVVQYTQGLVDLLFTWLPRKGYLQCCPQHRAVCHDSIGNVQACREDL